MGGASRTFSCRFKELCEVQSPVQALTFLQQEVYSMVDHSSDEETQTFRALHSHLFQKIRSPEGTANPPDLGLEDDDAAVHMDEAEQITEPSEEDTLSYHEKAPLEEEDGYKGLDKAHFIRRTEVFESLLDLVNSDAKQPESDLIRIMEEIDMSYA